MADRSPFKNFIKKYDFRWEALDMILNGKSFIDSYQGFGLRTHDEVEAFIRQYGLDCNNPVDQGEILGNLHEAVSFVRRYFLKPENPQGLDLEIPRRILEITDVRDLFLIASMSYPGQLQDSQGVFLKDFACAILKVVHTIAHADKDLRTSYFGDIQQQIMDRYYRAVQRLSDGRLFLGNPEREVQAVELVSFETKPKKTRDSTLLKLLHKPENVAEDIFDRLGIRFITKTKLDALRVVEYLRTHMVIVAPNLKLNRSRNTLINIDQLRKDLHEELRRFQRGEADEAVFVDRVDSMIAPPESTRINPHSSEYYRALQFTSRQFVKMKNPVYDELKELKALAKKGGLSEETQRVIDRIDLKFVQRETRFFYPYEVQIMDQTSAIENEKGRSAHSEYKRQQVQTAMKRVMGPLVDAVR